jgi:hypothetical protein
MHKNMKNIMRMFAFVLGCVGLLTACSDDNDSNPIANKAPSELVLNTPAIANQYIELTDKTTLSFTWSEPDFGYSALATYRFQVGVKQEDGTVKWNVDKNGEPKFLKTPYTVWNADVSAKEVAMAISNVDGFESIDDYVDMGVRTIAFRLYGNIRSGVGEDVEGTGVFSNPVYLNNVQSYAVVEEPGWIYICGNITGWQEPGAGNKEFYDNWRVTETGVETGIYKASFHLDRQDGDYIQFRFYTELTGWDTDSSIGLSKNEDCQWDSDGKYKGKILTDGRYEGNYRFDVASAGTLDITVNMNTNKVEFQFTPDN